MIGSRAMSTSPAGLYIHVPFCRKRCPFCDFAITTALSNMEAYLDALEREMDLRAPAWDLPFDTVYLGGGTPSVLAPGMIARILEGVRGRFRIERGAEVTLEVNPRDFQPADFERLLAAGANRISLGIQSFDDAALTFLGRDHTVEDSLDSYRAARAAGFDHISIDLIYARPGATAWAAEIDRAGELGPEHISAYQLTHEPGTAMTRRVERGEIAALAECEARDLLIFTGERMAAAGYLHYEVSSFPRSLELESRHNRKYWEGAPYLGLGPSAHSYRDPERWWNVPRLPEYLAALADGGGAAAGATRGPPGDGPVLGREVLGRAEKRLERLFLGLRTARGVDLGAFRDEFAEDLAAARREALEDLLSGGLAALDAGFLRLTPRGLALADEIAMSLAGGAAGTKGAR
jgi:putative oxygen-independent coproporphyrinogen III oxidase